MTATLAGLLEELVGERCDGLRHGGREEQALPLGGQELHDALERVDEAEIEHLVGLVEDEDLDLAQAQRPPVDKVEQAAGRGDQDIDAAGDLTLILADRGAAEHDGGRQSHVPAIGAEAVGDLHRQLARRAEHQRPAGLAQQRPRALGEAVENRQREGCRLAGAGLGDAAQVAAGEDLGDGLRLDGGGVGIALGREGFEKRLGKAETEKVGEIGQNPSFDQHRKSPR